MDHKLVLNAALENLTENLSPDDVLIRLVTKGAITNDHKQEIVSQPSGAKQVAALVEILRRREPKHYEVFMNVLKEKRRDLWDHMKSKEVLCSAPDPGETEDFLSKEVSDGTEDFLSREVSDGDMAAVALQIGAWDQANLLLFYTGLKIPDEERRMATLGVNGPVDKVLRILEKWRDMQDSNATRDKILVALGSHNKIIKSLKTQWKAQ